MQSFAHFTPTPQKIVAQKPKTVSSKEEFEVIKTHCMQGANMLRRLENFEDEPLLQTAYDIARWHHERWDGRGYPDGLKGNDIPISAQIVSLADVYDALTSERCYKEAFSHETAMRMILNGSLYPYLMEVEQTAESQMQQTMQGLLKQNPAPNKEQHQMGWVQHMNSLKAQAEELVLNELIYS